MYNRFLFFMPTYPAFNTYPSVGKFLSSFLLVLACAFAGGGQIAYAQTYPACGEVFLEMGDENDPNASQLDCYQVKIPFYLATDDPTVTSIEAFEMNIAIQFDYKPSTSTPAYPPIEVVDAEIPTQTSGGMPFQSGFGFGEFPGSNYFFIKQVGGSETNPITFEVNQSTPSFYAIVDVRHGADFEAKVVNFEQDPTEFSLVNTALNPSVTVCEFEDIEIQGNDDHRGSFQGVNFCSGTAGADDIRLKIDLDGINDINADISNGQGQIKEVPVKLVVIAPGAPPTIDLSRLDFRIDFTDVEGNLQVRASNYGVSGLENIPLPEINISEGYIADNLSEGNLSSAIFEFVPVTGSSNYEIVLFNIEVEAPINPPAAGEIEFTGDYARLKYDGGPCCLPQVDGGGTVLLEEFERYCGNNTASYIEIVPLNETLEEDEVGLDVRMYVDPPGVTQIGFNQLFIEAEVNLEGGLTLDEVDIETTTDICPSNCSATDEDYPSSGCIEVVPGTNIIRYGFCATQNLDTDESYRLFTIQASGGDCDGRIRSININRAIWKEGSNNACVPDIRHNYQDSDLTTDIDVPGTVFTHCTVAGNYVAGLEGVQIEDCEEAFGDILSGTDGSFELTEICRNEGAANSFSAQRLNSGDAANGVSTLDRLLVSRHILGVAPLDQPWKYIAADVNNSLNISTLDLIQMQKVVLGIDIDFELSDNWELIGENYTIPGNPDPFATSFQYSDLDCFEFDLGVDDTPAFYAIKKGDVNGDVEQCSETTNYAGDFEIKGVNNTTATHIANGKVAFGAAASGTAFTDVLGFQAALRFDTAKLTLDTLLAKDLGDVDGDIYQLDSNDPSLLRISWFAENGTARDLSSTEQAFELVFDLNSGSALSFSDVWIDTTEMAPELYVERDSTIDRYRLTLGAPASGFLIQAPGNGQLPASQAVAQELTVLPNPSSGDFTIKAMPQAASPVRLQVLDSSGKILINQEADLSSDWQLPAQSWPAGLYLLRTEVKGELYTSRLIKQ
ncbi:MAG: T9SS type A sorting domain-containing protein [Bacteroidetes bacterium]|jgi:hypothetical protein|nr:T9SS type A sorting domain-containing protein [Bacteroidota bacterium]